MHQHQSSAAGTGTLRRTLADWAFALLPFLVLVGMLAAMLAVAFAPSD